MIPPDDLFDRVRAADPARGRAPGDATAADAARGRDAVVAARRRRAARRRARAGAAGTGLAAFLGALALGFSGGGDGGPGRAGLPGLDRVVAAAAHAADPPNGRIVELTTVMRVWSDYVDGGHPFRVTYRSTRWIRTDRRGRVLRYRMLYRSGAHPGLDIASYRGDGFWWTDEWGPPRRRPGRWGLERSRSQFVAESLTLNAARLLRRAQDGRGPHLELVGRTPVEGRPAYRLRIDSLEEPPHHGYKELFVDARTYAPVKHTERRWGVADSGREYVSGMEEVVESRRVLADTPEHRRLLLVRGPTR